MQRLIDIARECGVRRLVGQVLIENTPMLHLMHSLGFSPPIPVEDQVVGVELRAWPRRCAEGYSIEPASHNSIRSCCPESDISIYLFAYNPETGFARINPFASNFDRLQGFYLLRLLRLPVQLRVGRGLPVLWGRMFPETCRSEELSTTAVRQLPGHWR